MTFIAGKSWSRIRLFPNAVLVSGVFLSSLASAQTLDPQSVRSKRFDDGSAENSWMISNPTGPGDFFNLDLDRSCDGTLVVGLGVETNATGAGASDGVIGL